jgi:putative membrane protein, TIGR04086 family/integral membrane protein, TIGR04097 family
MEKVKKYLISIGYVLAIIAGISLVLCVLNYFDIIGGNLFKWFKVFTPIAALVFSSFKLGRCSLEKGYLEGLKFGGVFGVLILLFSFLGFNHISFEIIIYELLILISCVFGAMFGISKNPQVED